MKEYKYNINGKEYIVSVGTRVDGVTAVTVNGESYDVALVPEPVVEKKVVVKAPAPAAKQEGGDDLQDALRSPLPGTIIDIPANVGDEVKEGDTLVVLEAMKMNNNLTAERDGKVKAILVQEGEAVKENTPLVTFE
ncbi:MAG: acetyl-CoA carboxylase biotin carboxyl carrier protein subunit [Prevotella sp.]|nr:acetyl-CoA carboxylase biotin carboxyl carrier protein subunit [Candidatus Prevotella equi]